MVDMRSMPDLGIKDLDDRIEDLEDRRDLVSLANKILENSRLVWTGKVPPEKGNADILKNNLSTMIDDLAKLKELELDTVDTDFTSIDELAKMELYGIGAERKNYFESAISIPRKLLNRVNKLSDPYDFASSDEGLNGPVNQIIFFAQYARPIKAMNDGATALKMAEQFREGRYTVPELNEMAEKTAMATYQTLIDGKMIEDKTPSQIGTIVWSMLNIIEPLVAIDDEEVLYHRIALGHPKGWDELNRRTQDTIGYINSVKEGDRYTIRMRRGHKMTAEYLGGGEWLIYLCFPELLSIEASPWLMKLLFKYGGKQPAAERPHPYVA